MFLIFLSSISFLSFNSLFIHFIFIFCCSPSAHAFYAVAKTVHSNETERIRANCKANQVSLSIKIQTRREEERAHDTKKKNVIYLFHSLCRKSTFISAAFVYTIITVINREFVLFYSILYSSNCGSKFLRVPREGEVKGYARLSPLA